MAVFAEMRPVNAARGAAAQMYGVIDRATALDLGVTPAMIKTKTLSGEWSTAQSGVYYLNVVAPDWRATVVTAVLAAGPDALASHRTAGRLFGLDGITGNNIEVTVPYSERPVPRGVIVHRTRRILPSTEMVGIRVTSIERTLLDLASLLPPLGLERAVMSSIRMGLTTPDEIALALRSQAGRGVRGTKKLRRVLVLTDDGITGSPAEVSLLSLIREAPIPMPEPQFPITILNWGNVYPDFAWPRLKKIVEVDGLLAHGSGDKLHNDLNRQNLLMGLGWEIRRFSARAVQREPDRVIGEIINFLSD